MNKKRIKHELGIKPDDLLQPGHPRFKEVYGHDPIADAKREAKKKAVGRENEKAGLEEKYWRMKKEGKIKPWDEKDIKKIVLEEKGW